MHRRPQMHVQRLLRTPTPLEKDAKVCKVHDGAISGGTQDQINLGLPDLTEVTVAR